MSKIDNNQVYISKGLGCEKESNVSITAVTHTLSANMTHFCLISPLSYRLYILRPAALTRDPRRDGRNQTESLWRLRNTESQLKNPFNVRGTWMSVKGKLRKKKEKSFTLRYFHFSCSSLMQECQDPKLTHVNQMQLNAARLLVNYYGLKGQWKENSQSCLKSFFHLDVPIKSNMFNILGSF